MGIRIEAFHKKLFSSYYQDGRTIQNRIILSLPTSNHIYFMQNDVLGLKIPMNDSMTMELVYRSANLFHKASCFDFWKRLGPLKLLEKLSSHGYLKYDVDMLLIFEASVHFDDVGVVQEHLDFDFSNELLHYLLFNKQSLVYHFEGTDKTTHLLPKWWYFYLARNTLPYFPEPRLRTSSKLSREREIPCLELTGLFLIQFFFFYSSFEV